MAAFDDKDQKKINQIAKDKKKEDENRTSQFDDLEK
jgi:hypothetical protein